MLQGIYFFLIGAFVGWMLECVFKYYSKNFTKSPGILNTPFCILYGLGTVALSMIIGNTTSNIFLLFVYSMIILTFMEYVTFILLQKVYGIKLWDYTDMKLKLNEKVCLEFAVVWGVLGVLYIRYILPVLNRIYLSIPEELLKKSLIVLLSIVLIDFTFTTYSLLIAKYNLQIEKIN